MRIDRRAPNRFSPTPDAGSYRTRPGDTLRRIAEQLGIRLADLAAANSHIPSVDAPLPPGQTLQIPTRRDPSAPSQRSSPMSFRVEYEKAHPNAFQRLNGPPLFGSPSDAKAAGGGLSGGEGGDLGFPSRIGPMGGGGGGDLESTSRIGPTGRSRIEASPSVRSSAVDAPWLALEKALSQGGSALKLAKAVRDFYATLQADKGLNPALKVRVGQLLYQLALQDQSRAHQNAEALGALTKFVQGLDSNYRRYRKEFGFDSDLAMGLAVILTFFQQQGNSILIKILKKACPQYFPKPGLKLQLLDVVHAALGFAEKALGIEVPQSVKDALKVLKYLPTSAVASLVSDSLKLLSDVLVALCRSATGDSKAWNQLAKAMLNQEYGPVYQGYAFLVDLVITGGRNITEVPRDKLLFSDFFKLFDTDPVLRATPRLDQFLRTLWAPVFLYGLYQTGRLNPADVASELFIDIERNGTRFNFVGRLTAALEDVISGVQTGRRGYEEWAMFREVVGAVVAEVLRRVNMLGPAWTARFRQGVDLDGLRRLYQRLNDPAVDRDLQMQAEFHGTVLSF
ncbi:MAG: LysM peptidoglycan-binding domain-containing protein [Acidobacteria bacterium]|nr:LysM peptidoglycan-binding domain-containing protein [Acidobacteriota bacterium]MDW7984994.1 LysM peptidoglycan-binding domain-containing protein [Acidobacteriota bacterium]